MSTPRISERGAERLARWAYTVVAITLLPILVLHLMWRGIRQPDYLAHWSERFLGRALADARSTFSARAFHGADAKVLWVHAVSVGETRAAAPLVLAWCNQSPHHRVVLTHTTPTGRTTGQTAFASLIHSANPQVVQRYLPYDFPWANALFLSWANPVMGVLMETELWPNLLAQARTSGVRMMLVNARLSPRSARRLMRFRALSRPAVQGLAGIAAQTDADAQAFQAVVAHDGDASSPAVCVVGNMKFDVTPPPELCALGRTWRDAFGGRRIWLAASTRDDEEREILAAWRQAQQSNTLSARDLLVVVPRHPQRFDRVARFVHESGFSMLRRSQPEWIGSPPSSGVGGALAGEVQVVLGDSLGEMFAYIAMADLVLMGGSLPALGGQNPVEASALGRPVFFGPHMFNFLQIARALRDCDAGVEIHTVSEWIDQGLALLADSERYARVSAQSLAFAQRHRGATDRTARCIDSLLGQ